MLKSNKGIIPTWLLIIIVIILVVSGGIFAWQYFWEPKGEVKPLEEKPVGAEQELPKPEIKCPNNWEEYKHDVLGIKFCYPKEWGKPKTEPKKEITQLIDLSVEYFSLFLKFGHNQNIKLRFFNEQYGGRYYPNGYSYPYYGYIDNINELKSSGDICVYKINFTPDLPVGEHSLYADKAIEIYNKCEENVKYLLSKKPILDGPRLHIHMI